MTSAYGAARISELRTPQQVDRHRATRNHSSAISQNDCIWRRHIANAILYRESAAAEGNYRFAARLWPTSGRYAMPWSGIHNPLHPVGRIRSRTRPQAESARAFDSGILRI